MLSQMKLRMGVPERIKEIEAEIRRTQINKATNHHVGLLRAKIARLKQEQEEKSGRVSKDDTEIRNYFGKKRSVIDIIVDLSKEDWTDQRRKNEVNELFKSINLEEKTRDIWFTPTAIERIGKNGWNESGQPRKYPSASRREIAKNHLVKMSEKGRVEYKFALLDKRQKNIVQFGEDGPSMHKMWRIKKEGIKFVLIIMAGKYVLDGDE